MIEYSGRPWNAREGQGKPRKVIEVKGRKGICDRTVTPQDIGTSGGGRRHQENIGVTKVGRRVVKVEQRVAKTGQRVAKDYCKSLKAEPFRVPQKQGRTLRTLYSHHISCFTHCTTAQKKSEVSQHSLIK